MPLNKEAKPYFFADAIGTRNMKLSRISSGHKRRGVTVSIMTISLLFSAVICISKFVDCSLTDQKCLLNIIVSF